MHTSAPLELSNGSKVTITQVAESLRAVADETRLRVLGLLVTGSPLCVCEMAESLHVPHYTISRHLNTLRRAELVESRREGTYVFYSISRSRRAGLLRPVFQELASASNVSGDASRLRKIVQLRDRQARVTAYCEVVEPADNGHARPNQRPPSGRLAQKRG
jgi:DNA-binding transcriptional ArsR family regulator